MRMNEHLNSDEELMPSLCESGSPGGDDCPLDFEFDTVEFS